MFLRALQNFGIQLIYGELNTPYDVPNKLKKKRNKNKTKNLKSPNEPCKVMESIAILKNKEGIQEFTYVIRNTQSHQY